MRSQQPPPTALIEHLRGAAGSYFAELAERSEHDSAPVEVTLVDTIPTTNAVLHRFELRRGSHAREVVSKSRLIRSRAADRGPAPPMPSVPDRLKVNYEMRALEAIDAHFRAPARPPFGTVRPLEVVVPDRVFVMEAAPGESVGRSLSRLPRSSVPSQELLASVRHSGAWLREFHQLPALGHTEAQPVSRDALLAWMRQLASLSDVATIAGVEGPMQRIEAIAEHALPAQLPRGLGHGDFHINNVIADEKGRVRIIDTFAAWSGPIYYDLSQYLYDLKAPAARMYDQGLRAAPAHVAVVEREFLRGYFGDSSVPFAAIRVFEIQWLLYRWARATRAAQRPGAIGHAKRARLALKSRFVAALLADLLRELEASAADQAGA